MTHVSYFIWHICHRHFHRHMSYVYVPVPPPLPPGSTSMSQAQFLSCILHFYLEVNVDFVDSSRIISHLPCPLVYSHTIQDSVSDQGKYEIHFIERAEWPVKHVALEVNSNVFQLRFFPLPIKRLFPHKRIPTLSKLFIQFSYLSCCIRHLVTRKPF